MNLTPYPALLVALALMGCGKDEMDDEMEGRQPDASVDHCTSGPTAWSLRAPRAIAPFDRNPGAIAVDDTSIYWTESLTCADSYCIPGPVVMSAPLTGGVPSALIESDEGQPGALAVTRNHLFVDIGEQVWRMGKNGAAPEAIDAATRFVADDDAIYFWEGSQIIRLAADTLERTTLGESSASGKNFSWPATRLTGCAQNRSRSGASRWPAASPRWQPTLKRPPAIPWRSPAASARSS